MCVCANNNGTVCTCMLVITLISFQKAQSYVRMLALDFSLFCLQITSGCSTQYIISSLPCSIECGSSDYD